MTGQIYSVDSLQGRKGHWGAFQEKHIQKGGNSSFISAASQDITEDKRECDETENPTGIDADRWSVRHASCASVSLCGWRSVGVRPRSVGVRTDPGQTGYSGNNVPISMPLRGRWDLYHGWLLGDGTIICAKQPQPTDHIPVSNTSLLQQWRTFWLCYY